ncbi:polyprenyl synthetase family protein [Allosaccharopolyspora coralli]|uniref:Polyprenyl synthetase family protein n=1 Tax=Allosaccharopolyspora coralli TaxID=2665642 RepID=A0A5Q3QFI0_9PSEU|nr:polyprenyl synthetase family protein [Allosaccharopolyspora coralli]
MASTDTDLPEHVHRALEGYLEQRLADCRELDVAVAEAAEALARFILDGGKRLRPTFAWWGWRAGGGAHSGPAAEAMVRAASALELIQACALVHDDLIDASATRRGKPTIHVRFGRTHRERNWRGDADQFGAAAAILLGDLALTWADDLLHTAGVASDALQRALPAWRAMRTEVLAGQYLDVLGQARGDESTAAALRIDELKSASYTVRRPLELGAAIADADDSVTTALREFGSEIGVAFQLRDDLLGVFGDPDVTGKPAGDDLREGKRTLLMAEAFETARSRGDDDALDLLRSCLGDPELDPARVETVRGVLHDLGAVRAVEERIEQLTGRAGRALDSVAIPEPAAGTLADLAIAVTDRTR